MKRQFLIIPDARRIEESAALAEKYGAAFEYNDFCDPAVYEDKDAVRRLCSLYQGLGRRRTQDTLHGAFLDVTVTSRDSVIRSRSRYLAEQSLAIAQALGVKGVVFHSGLIAGLQTEDYLQGWLLASEHFWGKMAQKYPDVTIYMENTFEQTPDMLLALKMRLSENHNFKLCFDYGHACLTSTPIEHWAVMFSKDTGHIHLNDNDGRADLHQVPGEGKLDFEKCKELLEVYFPQKPVLLELRGIKEQERALAYMDAI